MRRFGFVLSALGVALLVTGSTVVPASASSGQVIVFQTEFTPLTTYANPEGCHRLPAAAHVLVNQSSAPVRIYADPLCLSPSATVAPGYGAHVSPSSGSFSAGAAD
jgi:hypothetical protein